MKQVTIKSLLFSLPLILMISCKPTLKVSSDYDRSANFSAYKTFSLYYTVTSRNVNQLNEERIWNSIRSEMTKKGYVENNNHPDLLVNAFTVVKNKKYLSATASNYGYGGFFRPYGFWAAGGVSTGYASVHAYDYKEGSLMIDVVDVNTNKLVWEGTGNAEYDKAPKNPEEVINNVVNKIMAGFPQGVAKKN